jgi:hypothetical protein
MYSLVMWDLSVYIVELPVCACTQFWCQHTNGGLLHGLKELLLCHDMLCYAVLHVSCNVQGCVGHQRRQD